MLPEQQPEIAGVVVALQVTSGAIERGVPAVPDAGRRHDAETESSGLRAQAKVGFFVNQEKAFVEQANGLDDASRRKKTTAVDNIDFHGRCAGRLELDGNSLENCAAARSIAAAIGDHLFGAPELIDDRANDAETWPSGQRPDQAIQQLFRHDRVVVEQEHPVGATLEPEPNSSVAAASEAEVGR
jgi:hypothetical protein